MVDKINEFVAELRDSSTARAEKILALKFTEHFVGDHHQPLHAADHKPRRERRSSPFAETCRR